MDAAQQQQRRMQVLQRHLSPSDSIGAAPCAGGFPAAAMPFPSSPASPIPSLDDPLIFAQNTSSAEIPRLEAPRRRAVIVAGARTPFVKSFADLMGHSALQLGVAAVSGLLQKTKLDPEHIDEVIWGNVVLMTSVPNIAREIVIDLNLPRKIPGFSCSRACLSGLQAIEQAVLLVEHGDAHCVIAGGSDSMSNAELALPQKLTTALGKYALGGGNKKGLHGVREMLREAGPPTGWVPTQPKIAERSTGKTMGWHADLMAEMNGVTREEQDVFAVASHHKAFAAEQAGRLAEEIVPIRLANGKTVAKDNLIRGTMAKDQLNRLKPCFRKAGGTVTAATSSALTDGASCVLVMSEEKARELGYPTDVTFRSFANVAMDPYPQLLLAPALAIPLALDKAGLTLDQIDVVEMHEAFAAQVLVTLKCMQSLEFAKKFLKRDQPIGSVPASKINPNGSSLAIGHPFSATGGRLVTSVVNELRRSNKRFALISICAAGGMGGVAILERTPSQ